MNIGFDLDGIFIDKPPFVPKELIELLYKGTEKKELKYRTPGRLEQVIRKISHHKVFRPPIKKNIIILKKLNKLNKLKTHRYHLVTGRFFFIHKQTERILNNYDLYELFEQKSLNILNEQPHIFKNKMIKKLKIKRFVDDDLDILNFLSKKNPDIIFYWLNEKENKKLANNLFAITDLETIIK